MIIVALSILKLVTFNALISHSTADENLNTLLDAIERNKDQCSDIEEFRVIIDEETGKLAPCSWIDDAYSFEDVVFRREAQCRKPYVRLACKRACGTCCGDNADHTFEYLNKETGITKDVTCAWLAASSESKKKDICPMKMGSCPDACEKCNQIPITYPIEPTPCRDDVHFRITFDNDLERKEPCSWIDDASNVDEVQFRRKEICWRKDVQKACRRACGECCGDNDSHLFRNTNSETGETKLVDCEWLSKRSDKKKGNICRLERGSCPDACGECASGSEAIDPGEAVGVCRDEPDFRLLVNPETGTEEPCSWIDDALNIDEVISRRKAHCKKQDVKNNCKRACGDCCGDNDSHVFEYVNSEKGTKKEVDCAWLASNTEKKRKKLCQIKKGSCPEACGVCTTSGADIIDEGEGDESDITPTTSGAGYTTSEAPKLKVCFEMTSFLFAAMMTLALGTDFWVY